MRARLLVPLFVLALMPTAAHAAEVIGPDSCKGCHPAAFQAWKESPHARALGALSAKQQKDARCLSCHSPEQAKGLQGVSCETCHGGGQYYAPKYVMKDAELARAVGLTDPSEKACSRCHDASVPSIKPFVFADKLKLIDHWSAERAARAAAKAPEKKVEPKKPGKK